MDQVLRLEIGHPQSPEVLLGDGNMGQKDVKLLLMVGMLTWSWKLDGNVRRVVEWWKGWRIRSRHWTLNLLRVVVEMLSWLLTIEGGSSSQAWCVGSYQVRYMIQAEAQSKSSKSRDDSKTRSQLSLRKS